jgi:hypothetical protein
LGWTQSRIRGVQLKRKARISGPRLESRKLANALAFVHAGGSQRVAVNGQLYRRKLSPSVRCDSLIFRKTRVMQHDAKALK